MNFPIKDTEKIDYTKPTITLDVNSVALKRPDSFPEKLIGLTHLEWNYFKTGQVELCVTPPTALEITQGQPLTSLGHTAYNRFQKSRLFKERPPGVPLDLSEQESNEIWTAIRGVLWPSVKDEELIKNQRDDVTQLFHHLTISGTLSNSLYVTIDNNFLEHADDIHKEFGVRILNPHEAWEEYYPRYNLFNPSDSEMRSLWEMQQNYFNKLIQESEEN